MLAGSIVVFCHFVFLLMHVTCFLRAMFDGLGHFISVVPEKNENCVLMFEIVEA